MPRCQRETSCAVAGSTKGFQHYGGEDIEYAYRLQQLTGKAFINNRQAVAETTEGKSLPEAIAQFEAYGATNLTLMQRDHPDMPRGFHTDRIGTGRIVDRAFLSVMNPVSDSIAKTALRIAPFAVQRQLINYLVIRAVHRGYSSTTGSS